MNVPCPGLARVVRFGSLAAILFGAGLPGVFAADRNELDLSGPGWSLWLDREATWKDDALFFPVPALDALPVNPPTGGWDALAAAKAVAVSVPGTVEEYLQTTPGPDGDIVGVSWWFRKISLPASPTPRRLLLRFESMRQRAEIFVNRQLVGYDVVGNSPVEVDITHAVNGAPACELTIRITDPAGNFDWRDSSAMRWGKYSLPMSHGFGGITGRVRLVACDAVYVDEIQVQNTPEITTANATVTVRNHTSATQRRDVEVRVFEKRAPNKEVFRTTLKNVDLSPGATELPVKITAPGALAWDPEHPNLHVCEATLRTDSVASDSDRRTFGFRWFAAENIGTDAVFRLNGKRIVLRSAISWGFWPVNGIYPTEELAEKQIRTAQSFGLNMLNFHRAIGNPIVFEKANELGLLYYEEPGAHKSAGRDPFGRALAREKLLRMVRRDRSHPSLVIYNLMNEWGGRNSNPDPEELANYRSDMLAAHQIDPARVITITSGWSRGQDIEDAVKLHFRPFDNTPFLKGWYDFHHAGGPAVWTETLYRSPTDYYGFTRNNTEIVFWGEEGAISTPPRLELINQSLGATPNLGWDGGGYLAWYRDFEKFLTDKKLRSAFPSLDALTSSMGDISLYHQGRKIENMRISNLGDGYAINGWEAELIENHSGVVDCFRNPKGNPAILAHYNQPLYVAVKVRNTLVQPGAEVATDFFAINEKDLRGPHRLRIFLRDAAGRELATREKDVSLRGGEVYGELIAENLGLTVPAGVTGACRIEASLLDAGGSERARGHDDIFVVDWRSAPVAGAGAVWETGEQVRQFLKKDKARETPTFARELGRLDWIVAARSPEEGEAVPVPSSALRQPNGESGLQTTFFTDQQFRERVHQRADPTVRFSVEDGASPDAALSVMGNYGVRWEGTIIPKQDGRHTFIVRTHSNGRARLVVNDAVLFEFGGARPQQRSRGTIELRAGVPASVRLEFFAGGNGSANCDLSWILPETDASIPGQLLERVRRDGTTLVVLERADAWMALLAKEPDSALKYDGSFVVGTAWLGGNHFVREHPLFKDLPVNDAMDWPYQSVVRNGNDRLGLRLEGEEFAAGCYHCYPMQLGTVVGVIPLGKGHVIFSTLDIAGNLGGPEGPADVARKLFSNYLEHAAHLAQKPPALAP
ncbi:MAG TPA: PA14 domain-containing protein [Opitutaceae bacterium]|nr:PA14 domain-containing protein [Opitutaceae bacterium]